MDVDNRSKGGTIPHKYLSRSCESDGKYHRSTEMINGKQFSAGPDTQPHVECQSKGPVTKPLKTATADEVLNR